MKKDSFLTKGASKHGALGEVLRSNGVSRRSFMKFCATTVSMMALPPAMIPMVARALEQARRPSVIWLSFQECTGCTESLTRAHTSTIESLIFDAISLDYHHTLQAASGHAAEEAREMAMQENYGEYLLVVDGSIPLGNPGYSTIAGISNHDMLVEAAKGAAAIIAVGTCSTYGGIPHAILTRPVRFLSAISSRTSPSSMYPVVRQFLSLLPVYWLIFLLLAHCRSWITSVDP